MVNIIESSSNFLQVNLNSHLHYFIMLGDFNIHKYGWFNDTPFSNIYYYRVTQSITFIDGSNGLINTQYGCGYI